ncbi:SirB2 family protein [Vibrio sp. HN007]|uniref:SirB2 family protein n=1 Tax=Vibrio iocasae TaxID=3098914 RepID=UPI0035D4D63B
MTMYLELKQFHVLTVLISISLYLFRFFRYYRFEIAKLQPTWFKHLPHLNDTLLLSSGIALISVTGFTPFTDAAPWLTFKLCGVFFYIFCGFLAMRKKASIKSRYFYFSASIGWLVFIVTLAIGKNTALLF